MIEPIWKPGTHDRTRNHDVFWVSVSFSGFALSRSTIRKHQSASDLQS